MQIDVAGDAGDAAAFPETQLCRCNSWLSCAAASQETQMQLRFEDCDIHSFISITASVNFDLPALYFDQGFVTVVANFDHLIILKKYLSLVYFYKFKLNKVDIKKYVNMYMPLIGGFQSTHRELYFGKHRRIKTHWVHFQQYLWPHNSIVCVHISLILGHPIKWQLHPSPHAWPVMICANWNLLIAKHWS